MENKKLDYFNLFYSIGAVLILFGVVCNILNFKYQSFFLVLGLSMEMLIFAITSIKYKNKTNDNQSLTDNNGLIDKNIQIGSDTFINIQTGSENIEKDIIRETLSKSDSVNTSNLQSITLDINNGQNVPNYINQKSNTHETFATAKEIDNEGNRSLSELENMDFISIKKDIFFHPLLDSLDEVSYSNLSILYYKLFNISLLDKKLIAILNNYPINIPVSDPNKLNVIGSPQIISDQEINLLFSSFSLLNYFNYSNNLIINQVNDDISIYNNLNKEIQVYGGERQEVIDHVVQFHSKDFIISPKIEIVEQFIEIKNQNLINLLIYKMSLTNSDELFSLANIIKYENEECKIKFLQKFNLITYNFETNSSYDCIKSFVIVALSIKNKALLDQIISNNLIFEINPSELINVNDIVYFKNDFVLFGQNNEYKIAIKDIFLNNELSYFKCLETLINKLVEDQVSNHSNLLDLFNFTKVDGIQDIFDKLNRSLSKRNTSPYGSQLAFILLYKQFN